MWVKSEDMHTHCPDCRGSGCVEVVKAAKLEQLHAALIRLDYVYRSEQDEPAPRPEWLVKALGPEYLSGRTPAIKEEPSRDSRELRPPVPAHQQSSYLAVKEAGAAELRWVSDGKIYGRPSATDALEYANEHLADPEELDCCTSDNRVPKLDHVRRLLHSAEGEKP